MRKILFLDRDGVINQDKHFVSRAEDIQFVQGIFQLCKYFRNEGYEIVIITNQSGIARGLFTEQDFHSVMAYILEEFRKQEIEILDFFYCPHGQNEECGCRKPLPGLFIKAINQFRAIADNCISIGDRERDIRAAIAAGVPQNYLLLSHKVDRREISSSIVTSSLMQVIEIHQSLPISSQE